MCKFNDKDVERAIIKGAEYLFLLQNNDGGIKYENASTPCSGIWVTAEALEFLLSSKNVPITAFNKIAPMLDFIVRTQAHDGSWSILPNEIGISDIYNPSSIATGHCIYALKLALVGNYLGKNNQKIKKAIENGETWLRKNKTEKDGMNFWGVKSTQETHSATDPNKDEVHRMEYIFTTFYAVMGLLNPLGYPEDNGDDQTIIRKTISFMNAQADFFINTYSSTISHLDLGVFAKVSSTICRIVCGLNLMNADIPDDRKNGLKNLLLSCAQSPFMTSSININIDTAKQYHSTYNNNTPFDMANALLCLGEGAESISNIIHKYLEFQQSEGFWYLNFGSSYSVTTWTTSEALIILERALNKYNLIELANTRKLINEEKEKTNTKIRDLEDKNTSLKRNALIAIIISIILSVLGIVAIAVWSGLTPEENKNKVLAYILDVLLVPLAVNILSSVIMALRNSDIIKSNKQHKNKANSNNSEEN